MVIKTKHRECLFKRNKSMNLRFWGKIGIFTTATDYESFFNLSHVINSKYQCTSYIHNSQFSTQLCTLISFTQNLSLCTGFELVTQWSKTVDTDIVLHMVINYVVEIDFDSFVFSLIPTQALVILQLCVNVNYGMSFSYIQWWLHILLLLLCSIFIFQTGLNAKSKHNVEDEASPNDEQLLNLTVSLGHAPATTTSSYTNTTKSPSLESATSLSDSSSAPPRSNVNGNNSTFVSKSPFGDLSNIQKVPCPSIFSTETQMKHIPRLPVPATDKRITSLENKAASTCGKSRLFSSTERLGGVSRLNSLNHPTQASKPRTGKSSKFSIWYRASYRDLLFYVKSSYVLHKWRRLCWNIDTLAYRVKFIAYQINPDKVHIRHIK